MTTPVTTAAAKNAANPAAGSVRLLQRKCECGASGASLSGSCGECGKKRLQPKLRIGDANDAYEQEADRVASAVMQAPLAAGKVGTAISRIVQRSAAALPTGTRSAVPDGAASHEQAAPPIVNSVLASAGRPLAPAARSFFEARLGHDFSRVRVHADGVASASARAVDAHAYTVGHHVVFGQGRYAPDTLAGRRLLAHELTHVVQQGGLLRRDSISPPLHGNTPEEDDREAVEPMDVQRLQRTPAIDGLDEAGPNADLSGENDGPRLAKIGECLKGKGPDPDECNPRSPLTWADFTAAPNAASPFGAVTASTIKKRDVPSQQCVDEVLGRPTGPKRIFQGLFVPNKSWVKSESRNAANPAANGSAALAAQCRKGFDDAAAKRLVGVTWALSTAPDAKCPSSVRPAGTPATKRAECATTIVADFTARAIGESARLLNHEQHHFKLTCAMAKKANSLLWRRGDFAAIDAVILTTLEATQTRYDGEAAHGCNAAAQATWETEIANGLPNVKLP